MVFSYSNRKETNLSFVVLGKSPVSQEKYSVTELYSTSSQWKVFI